jgi:hypothetical protein
VKDFRRRLELRLLMQHETRMSRPVDECAPHLCERCQAPLPKRTSRQGLRKRWCEDCRKARLLESNRKYMQKRRSVPETMED